MEENNLGGGDLNLTDAQAKIKELEDKLAQQQSASDKWVQKVLNEKKQLEFIMTGYEKLEGDQDNQITNLQRLHSENPELTQQLLDKFYNWVSYESVVGEASQPKQQAGLSEEDVQKKVEEWIRKAKLQEKIDWFVDKLWLSEEDKQKFLEALDENTPAKGLNLNNLNKILKHSYSDISDDISWVANQEVIANAMASGWKSNTPSKAKVDDSLKSEVKDFLKNFG